MGKALYNILGGAEAVHAAVELFYKKMLADSMLAPFFDGMNIERIKAHQRVFFTALLGVSVEYNGRDLRAAHSGLVKDKGLTDIHFDRTVQHLKDTFDELGIDENTTKGLLRIIETLRDDVLNK